VHQAHEFVSQNLQHERDQDLFSPGSQMSRRLNSNGIGIVRVAIPGFLFLDQPSQAHYPPEKDLDGSIDALADEDQTAVTELFQLIYSVANDIAPELQVIVMDHADLKTDWFAESVTARWRGNEKLIPETWYS
jgi:hypothetical protein